MKIFDDVPMVSLFALWLIGINTDWNLASRILVALNAVWILISVGVRLGEIIRDRKA